MAEATSSPFAEALAAAEAEHGQSVHTAMDEAQAEELGTATTPPAPETPESEEVTEVPADDEAGETEEAPEVQEVEEQSPEVRKLIAKINGEEVELTEEEAVNGYQRQADYTRKSQEVAEMRAQVEAERVEAETALNVLKALEENPAETLQRLAANLEIDLDNLDSYSDEELDPLEAKVNELTQWHADQQEAAQEAEIFAEIDAIKAQYEDPDLDPQDLLQHAMEYKLGDLDKAYKSLSYDKLTQRVKDEKAAAQAAADAKIVESKRTAPPIEGGSHRNGAVSDKAVARPKSIAEAYAQSVEELGG